MADNSYNSNSLIPSTPNGLIKAGNSIQITNKLLSESKYEYYKDFKGEQIWKIEAHTEGVSKIAIGNLLNDGNNYMISAGVSGNFKLWNTDSGHFISEFQIENRPRRSITIYNSSKDNQCFVFIGFYRFQLDLSGNPINIIQFDNSNYGIRSLISQDNLIVRFGQRHNLIRIYDPIKFTIKLNFEVNEWADAITLIEEENILLTSDPQGLINAWDLTTGKELFFLQGHIKAPISLSYCKQKKILASCSDSMYDKLTQLSETLF